MEMNITENGRLLNVGVIGLGGRGQAQLKLICTMQDVKVLGVCDVYEDRMQKGMEIAPGAKGTQDYHDILAMPEVEAVFIFTDWVSHIPIAIEAMKAGKEVAMEVGGATSVAECWDMV
ncbi:MAG: Gfo/Idh/MocA family oxidoreductase [Clostridia bacterium]|nr:Gfo/Idh/MocA family oxidoreductase [Clostridia bacterium]